MSPAPHIVVGSHKQLREACRLAEGAGMRVRDGFGLPAEPFDLSDRSWACAGPVDQDEDVSDAVLAAARGVIVIAQVAPSGPRWARLVDDLRRLGPVKEQDAGARAAIAGPDLGPDGTVLLRLLAEGQSLPEAAAAVHLSLRTAERRLRDVRTRLGVRTTAEAIQWFTRGGGLPG